MNTNSTLSPIPPHSLPSTSSSTFYTNINKTKKHKPPSLLFTITSSSTHSPNKHVWKRNSNNTTSLPTSSTHQTRHTHVYLDHSVDMDDLLLSISQTSTQQELYSLLSIYKDRQLSLRFMVSVLARETDWQRTVALLDWMIEEAGYIPSVFAYNVVIRNVLRAKQWELGTGLVEEMRKRAISPDKFTYSTLITQFGKEGCLTWPS